MKQEKIKTKKEGIVIFDFDGVLVDTISLNFDTFFETFSYFGHSLKKDVGDFVVGESLKNQFEKVNKKYDTKVVFERFKSKFEEIKNKKREKKTIRLSMEFVNLIKSISKNFQLIIISANKRHIIEKALSLDGLEKYFKEIIALDSFGSSKKESFKRIIRGYGKNMRIFFIDDVIRNIEVAHKLGIQTIAYRNKYNAGIEFPIYCRVAKSPKEIEEHILKK